MLSAPGELAFEQAAGKPPAVMVLEALPCPERDSVQEGRQPCRDISCVPPFARHLAQGEIETGQMMARLAPRPQQPRNHQRPEPGPVLERLDGSPGIIGERGREERRQRTGALDHAAPLLKAGAL